jgi:hypothetical protein
MDAVELWPLSGLFGIHINDERRYIHGLKIRATHSPQLPQHSLEKMIAHE